MSEFIKMIELMQSPGPRLLEQLTASTWTMHDGDLLLVKGPLGGIPGVFKLFHDMMKRGVLHGDAEPAAHAFLHFLESVRVQKDVCRFEKGQMGGEECARQVSECIAAMIHSPRALACRYQRLFAKAMRLEMVNLALLFALVPGMNITKATA
jgi:hypothetical protein